MKDATQRKLLCLAVMAFSGVFMANIWQHAASQDLNQMSTAAGVFLGSTFAALIALFKFAFDFFDGKLDGQ